MKGRLEGKVALVTGAASGIGLAITELFLDEGACIVAADIQDEKGKRLEARFPGRLTYVHCDVVVEAEIQAAVRQAVTMFGRLDVLVNNAGICDMMANFAEIEVDRWDWIFAVLLRGPLLGIKHAEPVMASGGGGAIINIASVAGLQPGWGPVAYSTAKAGLLHLSRAAAAQLATKGIRVNAICPGMIATSIFGASIGLDRSVADQLAARVADASTGVQPIQRAGMPQDIAQAALYLAMAEAGFVTGTHLVVDGGLTIGPRHAWDPATPPPLAGLFSG